MPLDNAVSRSIFYGRGRLRYEPTLSGLLSKEWRPGDLFVDGGAAFGWYTALAIDALGRNGVVYAVEANRARARVLADDLRRARVTGTPVVGAALGSTPGRALLRGPEPDADVYQFTIADAGDGAGEGLEVEVITLDSLELPRLSVLKLDIEGAELDALLGAEETIKRCKPRLLLIEVIEDNLGRFGRTVDDLAAFLDLLNYAHEPIGGTFEAPMWKCWPRES